MPINITSITSCFVLKHIDKQRYVFLTQIDEISTLDFDSTLLPVNRSSCWKHGYSLQEMRILTSKMSDPKYKGNVSGTITNQS